VLLTRSPLIPTRRWFTVRLACVKHAASVRPEPGSNSPLMSLWQAARSGVADTMKVSWHRQMICRIPKESVVRSNRNPTGPGKPPTDGVLALTFGTLLSSQGADAHRSGPFGPSSGQLSYFTGYPRDVKLPTPGIPPRRPHRPAHYSTGADADVFPGRSPQDRPPDRCPLLLPGDPVNLTRGLWASQIARSTRSHGWASRGGCALGSSPRPSLGGSASLPGLSRLLRDGAMGG
jgi:hypothetical protein